MSQNCLVWNPPPQSGGVNVVVAWIKYRGDTREGEWGFLIRRPWCKPQPTSVSVEHSGQVNHCGKSLGCGRDRGGLLTQQTSRRKFLFYFKKRTKNYGRQWLKSHQILSPAHKGYCPLLYPTPFSLSPSLSIIRWNTMKSGCPEVSQFTDPKAALVLF